MPGAHGTFVLAPLDGPAGERIAAIQRQYDPKLAAESIPHITLVGSSGSGPIEPTVPWTEIQNALAPVVAEAEPLSLPFGIPERFPGTNVIALPLSPHGPLRALHDRMVAALVAARIPMARGRFTFTPHATLSFYPTLAPARVRELLALRFDEPAQIERIDVSYTRSPQRAVRWGGGPLGGQL